VNNTPDQTSGTTWQRRHTVVLLCFLSTFICYIDRVNISVAIIPMAKQFGWPSVFYVFGAVGMIWFVFWRLLVTDTPALDKRMSEAERALFQQEEAQGGKEVIPWREILTQKPVWAIIIAHFSNNWGLYVLLSWLPSYFSSQLGIGLKSVWIYVALALIALASVKDANIAVILLTLSMGFSSFSFAGFATNHLDIAPRHAGIIFGISNTAGTLPGIIGVALTGLMVEATGSYASAFYLTAAMYAMGLVVWQLYSTGERVL